MNNNAQNGKTGGSPRVITLRLRLPVLIAALALLLIGLAWMFFLGVLAGRGYHAEDQIGFLAAIMPAPQAEATGGMNPETAARDGAPPGETASLDTLFADEGLLKSEDLNLKDALRAPVDKPGAPPAPAAAAPATVANATADASRTVPPPANAGASVNAVYDYVYQVASFNRQQQALSLKQKLEAAGFSAQIELFKAPSGTWYRVLAGFRSKNSELPVFLNKLEKYNRQPVLRKKQAVAG